MKILVIDVGGSHIKLRVSGQEEMRKVASGPVLTAQQMVDDVKEATKDWKYDAISMGFPGPVADNKILLEPVNLGKGWVEFDFSAARQTLQNHQRRGHAGTRQLRRRPDALPRLGDRTRHDADCGERGHRLELGHLPYKKDHTFEQYVGTAGLKTLGRKKWKAAVFDVVARLKAAFSRITSCSAAAMSKSSTKCRLAQAGRQQQCLHRRRTALGEESGTCALRGAGNNEPAGVIAQLSFPNSCLGTLYAKISFPNSCLGTHLRETLFRAARSRNRSFGSAFPNRSLGTRNVR